MTENELSKVILNACYQIHTKLGPGLLESVYEEILNYELSKQQIPFSRQQGIPVIYDDVKLDLGFRTAP